MEVRWSSLGKFSFGWSIFEVPETVRRSEPVIGSEIVISNYIKSFWVQRKEKGSVISAENTENGQPGEDPMIFFFKKRRT
ncbi:hypothetical protein DY000_02021271 [Brassica cretica]|uniref:Uncharacterized protein n=1 Tax=Brassica cretica TaxID=69181 RepID=A0ABQ7EAL3_BRACR|nr:hypothetical protein DY000_02021271 [Brassica cretica]